MTNKNNGRGRKVASGLDEWTNRSWTLYESYPGVYRVYLDGIPHRWGVVSREGDMHDRRTWRGALHLADRSVFQTTAVRVREYLGYQSRKEVIRELVWDLDSRH